MVELLGGLARAGVCKGVRATGSEGAGKGMRGLVSDIRSGHNEPLKMLTLQQAGLGQRIARQH